MVNLHYFVFIRQTYHGEIHLNTVISMTTTKTNNIIGIQFYSFWKLTTSPSIQV
jgi:hypothetical protein